MLKCTARVEEQIRLSRKIEEPEFDLTNQQVEAFRLSFIQKRESLTSESESDFYTLLHVLQILLCELTAGTLVMKEVLGINRAPKFQYFQVFLSILEVYGTGYLDDVDYQKYN